MRAIVGERWAHWTESFESLTRFFYCDVLATPEEPNVTIGDGILCPLPLALTIPFEYPDGSPATAAEIEAAWKAVAAQSASGRAGGAHFAAYTVIRATLEGLSLVSAGKLRLFESQVRRFFPGWDDACADAQLPVLSKAWAGGGLFEEEWPHFTAAWNAGAWEECAVQAMPSPARMAAQNESYHRRIAAEQRHLRAAATAPDPESFSIWP